MRLPTLTRRDVTGLLAAGAIFSPRSHAFNAALTLEVAGPAGSSAAFWARRLQAGANPGPLNLRFAGGVDGVTGLNQFNARVMPDGSTAILFPGAAPLAWLAGDSRVRFDLNTLVPLLAITGPGVLVSRTEAGRAPLRVACAGMPGSGLVALLGLDLLGIPGRPVPCGLDRLGAVRSGRADAAFVTGTEFEHLAGQTGAGGLRPVFSVVDSPDAALPLSAPGLLDQLPQERRRSDPLVAAWQAMAAAATLHAAVALPRLSPASSIRHWRRLCGSAGPTLDRPDGMARPLFQDAAASTVQAMLAPDSAILALRRWASERLGPQAG